MASTVSICNMALTALGAARITDITEDSENARRLNAIYQDIKDEVLMSHPWNFAIKRATLAALSAVPEWEYDAQFQLPSDCIRVLNTDDDSLEYKIEGRVIVTNGTSLKIRYIARIDDPAQFSPGFVTALAERLAAELAYPVTSSTSLRESMLKTYQLKHSFAKAFDGQEGSPEVAQTDIQSSRE